MNYVLKQDDDLAVVVLEGEKPTQYEVGVWALADGRLVWWHEWADEVEFLADSVLVLLLDAVDKRLVRYTWPGLVEVESVPAPQYAEKLVVAPSERRLVVFQNDGQGMNGYSVFDLDGPIRQLGVHIGLSVDPMYAMPAFSASERVVASAPGTAFFWQPPEDRWPADYAEEAEIPSLGGVTTFAVLILHDLDTDTVTRHDLQFDLEAGWVPDDCWDARWEYGPIGLEFAAEDVLRLQLADGQWVEVGLPAAERVLLPTPNSVLP